MRHAIVIDDRNMAARHLLSYVQEVAKTNPGISISEFDVEELEDFIFGKMIQKDRKSGLLNKNEKQKFLSEIGLK